DDLAQRLLVGEELLGHRGAEHRHLAPVQLLGLGEEAPGGHLHPVRVDPLRRAAHEQHVGRSLVLRGGDLLVRHVLGGRDSAAGQMPDSRPTNAAKPTPKSTVSGRAAASSGDTAATVLAAPRPTAVPTAPPTADSTTASSRNCTTMVRRRAPMARRTPISRVR